MIYAFRTARKHRTETLDASEWIVVMNALGKVIRNEVVL